MPGIGRGVLLTVCAAAVLAPVASAAVGGQPRAQKTREQAPAADQLLRGYCSFPVRVHTVVDDTVAKTFPDGHTVVRGRLILLLTNVRNGRHTVINASGPLKIFPHPGGRVVLFLRGRTFLTLTARQSGQGHPIMWLTRRGTIKIVVDKAGNARMVRFPNRHVDLCARIARRA